MNPSLVLTRDQLHELDRRAVEKYRMPSVLLMENAGRGCVEVFFRIATPSSSPVVVVCGKGNNGGDGFVIARRLDLLGVPVRVVLVARPEELRGDAAVNWAILENCDIDVAVIEPDAHDLGVKLDRLVRGEWIVDALLGTGASGEPRSPIADAIVAINRSPAKKLAVDLPSGLDCDTGRPAMHTVRADHTCTFVALKPGFLRAEAAEFLGQVHVVDIGCPRKLVEEVSRSE